MFFSFHDIIITLRGTVFDSFESEMDLISENQPLDDSEGAQIK